MDTQSRKAVLEGRGFKPNFLVNKPNQSMKQPLHKDYLHRFPTTLASLKEELEGKVKHYEKNISVYRRFHSFSEKEGE